MVRCLFSLVLQCLSVAEQEVWKNEVEEVVTMPRDEELTSHNSSSAANNTCNNRQQQATLA
jgi:hypothetical protein